MLNTRRFTKDDNLLVRDLMPSEPKEYGKEIVLQLEYGHHVDVYGEIEVTLRTDYDWSRPLHGYVPCEAVWVFLEKAA